MVTASTALTIFIMNIHHCGSEARPVPKWAERFILNYLARVCFVSEFGDSCLGRSSSRKHAPSGEESDSQAPGGGRGASWDVNGQPWVGKGVEDEEAEPDRTEQGVAQQTVWKEDLFVTIDHSEEEEEEGRRGGCVEAKKGVGGAAEEILVRTRCVCQHQRLLRSVEYIASSYQDQRSAQVRIAEWRKVAKVMDRFFMWLFFIMFFFMSILILSKAI